MGNVIITAVLLMLIGAAIAIMIKAKKSGRGCMGCASGGCDSCGQKTCPGCHSGHDL